MSRPPRILMLAPEPVLQPRGTPMSVYYRLRALSALGYEVDLITYPLGEPIDVPGVRVLRAWRPWGLRRIKIGPSLPKVVLDAFMVAMALGCLLRRRYAALHSHEEMVFPAAVFAGVFKLPHLYDMHSSLSQQFRNWRKWYAAPVSRLADTMERWAIRRSQVLITICQALTDQVRLIDPSKPLVTIENAATLDAPHTAETLAALRAEHDVTGAPLIVYTGNFEPYQGVDLLLESFTQVARRLPAARLMMIGGTAQDIAAKRAWAQAHGVATAVRFVGTVPPQAVSRYLAMADALVSPRIAGTNTPLKIYAYLKSGKPVVATDLPTHTQVLSIETAFLAAPQPGVFAEALHAALTDPARAGAIAQRALALAQSEFSEEGYRTRVAQGYRLLLGERVPCAASPA